MEVTHLPPPAAGLEAFEASESGAFAIASFCTLHNSPFSIYIALGIDQSPEELFDVILYLYFLYFPPFPSPNRSEN